MVSFRKANFSRAKAEQNITKTKKNRLKEKLYNFAPKFKYNTTTYLTTTTIENTVDY